MNKIHATDATTNTTSKFAIASLALASGAVACAVWPLLLLLPCQFCLLGVPAIACGHIARAQIKRTRSLKGNRIALIGLIAGYCSLILPNIHFIIVESAILEPVRQIVDNGTVLFDGEFPQDAFKKDPERKDFVLAPIVAGDATIGTIESRDKNLRLVYLSRSGQTVTIWQYQDYGNVNRITFDQDNKMIRVYYDRTFLRRKNYVIELFIEDSRVKTSLLQRGEWL